MRASLTNENINKACTEIERYLNKRKTGSRDAIRIQLSAEETLLSYQKAFGEGSEFFLDKGRRFGRGMIRLRIRGDSLDPFAASEFSSDEDIMMRNALTRMGMLPRWRFRRGANEILFIWKEKKLPDWQRFLLAIAAAVFLGLLARLSPDSVRLLLRDGIITPLIDTFLGFLNAVAGPMIFLSIVWSIYSVGDASTFSEIGRRISFKFGLYLILMTVLSALLSIPFFSLHFGASQASLNL